MNENVSRVRSDGEAYLEYDEQTGVCTISLNGGDTMIDVYGEAAYMYATSIYVGLA